MLPWNYYLILSLLGRQLYFVNVFVKSLILHSGLFQAFGIDPVSLTPQASMLHLGRVVSVDVENVLLQPLTHPNIGRASFGRASARDEQEELVEQISKPLKEVWSNEWKLISHK
jgi:hypothetical protein